MIAAASAGGNSAGKGAWDCDTNREIPPNKEARACSAAAASRRAATLLVPLLRLRQAAGRGRDGGVPWCDVTRLGSGRAAQRRLRSSRRFPRMSLRSKASRLCRPAKTWSTSPSSAMAAATGERVRVRSTRSLRAHAAVASCAASRAASTKPRPRSSAGCGKAGAGAALTCPPASEKSSPGARTLTLLLRHAMRRPRPGRCHWPARAKLGAEARTARAAGRR